MSDQTNDARDPVAALMLERQRFETWLAALDERRAETPQRVYERVHADYSSRLESVIRELGEHRESVERSIAEHISSARTIEEQELVCREERAEAELRAAVGEYTSERWEEVRQESDATLERLRDERERVAEELARLREALAATEPGAAAAESAGAKDAGHPGAPEQSAEPRGAGAAATPGEAATGTGPATDKRQPESPAAGQPAPPRNSMTPHGSRFDELAFLSSVVESAEPVRRPSTAVAVDEEEAGAESTSRSPEAGAQPDKAQSAHSPSAPAAAARQAPAPQAPAPQAPASPAPAPRAAEAPARHEPAKRPDDRKAPPPPSGPNLKIEHDAPAPFQMDHAPTLFAAEATKSLKCSECGTMNYPTEWYCERCGGELAAL